MLKDVVRALDYSDCAEVALLLFLFAFGLVLLTTFRLSPEASKKFASIPLSDKVEDPRDE